MSKGLEPTTVLKKAEDGWLTARREAGTHDPG